MDFVEYAYADQLVRALRESKEELKPIYEAAILDKNRSARAHFDAILRVQQPGFVLEEIMDELRATRDDAEKASREAIKAFEKVNNEMTVVRAEIAELEAKMNEPLTRELRRITHAFAAAGKAKDVPYAWSSVTIELKRHKHMRPITLEVSTETTAEELVKGLWKTYPKDFRIIGMKAARDTEIDFTRVP